MFPQNDGGNFANQGYVQDWQGLPAGRYAGQAQVGLTRGEAWQVYHVALNALQENLRRRDRANWFFLSAGFAFLTALLVLLVAFDHKLVETLVSLAALFIGGPLCCAWRWTLKCSSELHERNLKTVRRIEQEYGLPPPPFTVDEPPLAPFGVRQSSVKSEQPSVLFSRWESFLPNVVLTLFLLLFAMVWQEQLIAAVNWVWDCCTAVGNWIWPATPTIRVK